MYEIERKIKEILEKSKCSLRDSDIKNASDFIVHGEYGVAFELICEQLYENDAVIEKELLNQIQDAACAMELKDASWEFLKRNTK